MMKRSGSSFWIRNSLDIRRRATEQTAAKGGHHCLGIGSYSNSNGKSNSNIPTMTSTLQIPKLENGKMQIRNRSQESFREMSSTTSSNKSSSVYTSSFLSSNDIMSRNGRLFQLRDSSIIIRNLSSKEESTEEIYTSNDIKQVWKNTTTRLIETPIGEMDTKLWHEARNTILWWLDQSSEGNKNNTNNNHGTSSIEIIQNVFLCLDRLCEEAEAASLRDGASNDNPEVSLVEARQFLNTDLLNLVINCWRKMMINDKIDREGKESLSMLPTFLLDKLYQYHMNGTELKPNTQTYAMIIDGAATCNDPREGVLVAAGLFDWIIQNAEEYPRIRPNVYTVSSLMNAWTKSNRADAPERVDSLLEDMKLLHLEHPDWDIAPNRFTYAAVIDAWGKAGDVKRVEELLAEMHETSQRENNPNLRPGLTCFNGYMVALCRTGELERARSLLEQMEGLYESGELDEKPGVVTYSTLIDGYTRRNDHNDHNTGGGADDDDDEKNSAADQARNILRLMVDKGIAPNTVSYNSVIKAYVAGGDMDNAESLLNEMYEHHTSGTLADVKPSMRTYSQVLFGWAKSNSPDAGPRAEQILSLMQEMADAGELDTPPDLISYNSVLDCWAKSKNISDAIVHARNFLDDMIQNDDIQPDVYSYNTVINALVRAGKIIEAENLFESMADTDVEPDITTYNTLLHGWTKSGLVKEAEERVPAIHKLIQDNPDVEADVITYNSLLNFYSKSGDSDSAEQLLDEMMQPNSSVKPDLVSFNTVIATWKHSKDEDAPHRAEAILAKLLQNGEHLRPNRITFNSVMSVWVTSGQPEAAENCEDLFALMTELQQEVGNNNNNNNNNPVGPDLVTYNTLIYAWSVSNREDAPDNAEAVFHEMKRLCTKEGQYRIKPTEKTYGSLIRVWSKSKRLEAGAKAEGYLRELLRKVSLGEVRPPRTTEFTNTIRAWGNSSGSGTAIYMADGILRLLLQESKKGSHHPQPDHHFFTMFLWLLGSSQVNERAKYADHILRVMDTYGIKPNKFNIEQLNRCYEHRSISSTSSSSSSLSSPLSSTTTTSDQLSQNLAENMTNTTNE